ncbi:DNA polymerase III subunit gamma/tau [Salinicola sp. RZ23]|uniref:DNA polymerase III subunit gamma/tau n=1 Tax=Salinicola sp. RZ23 TaxID=1949087 RepID=UPI000DA1F014|nr:DNA polymerase III subunit gamma/tau [Salinicola sp. RZ23]
MSYQVLARKWRPRTFHELVGQDHVSRALVNALDQGRLHHAYLFTGTRGVGKTTLARILAKCLNCEQGVGSTPCGVCQTCRDIDDGRFVDLIEVDAASRTKVEDTRELLDNVQYAPTQGRFKVYLIDEVHMLSTHSFNALLKTLEEPPPHVKFLLATTDPQKLPVTVLSRCLQFTLKNMPPERVVEHLTRVLEAEQVAFEPPALWLLGKAADGSMRDALSLTDQAIAFGQGEIRRGDVAAMLGTLDHAHLLALAEALAEVDAERLLAEVAALAEQGPDFAGILDEIAGLMHRLAIAQMVPSALDNGHGDRDQLLAMASRFTAEDVQLYYQIALQGRGDIDNAPDTRTALEMTLLRMLAFRPQGVPTPPQTDLPLRGEQPSSQSGSAPAAPAAAPSAPASTASSPAPTPAVDASAPTPAVESTPETSAAPSTRVAPPAQTLAHAEPAAASPQPAPAADSPPWAVEQSETGAPSATTQAVDSSAPTPAVDSPAPMPAVDATPETPAAAPSRAAAPQAQVPASAATAAPAPGQAGDTPPWAVEPASAGASSDPAPAAALSAATPAVDSSASTPAAGGEPSMSSAAHEPAVPIAADAEPASEGAWDADPDFDDADLAQDQAAAEAAYADWQATPEPTAVEAEEERQPAAASATAAMAPAAAGEHLTHAAWLERFDTLEIGGLTRNLAAHCVVTHDDGKTLALTLDPGQSAILSEMHVERITKALAAQGFARRVAIEVGPLDGRLETARDKRDREARERHAQAVEALRGDPHVHELESRFGARLLEESVTSDRV